MNHYWGRIYYLRERRWPWYLEDASLQRIVFADVSFPARFMCLKGQYPVVSHELEGIMKFRLIGAAFRQ